MVSFAIIGFFSVFGYFFDSTYDNPISRAFVENNFEYILGLCVVLVLYSFNIISVDKKGIKKTLFFIFYWLTILIINGCLKSVF